LDKKTFRFFEGGKHNKLLWTGSYQKGINATESTAGIESSRSCYEAIAQKKIWTLLKTQCPRGRRFQLPKIGGEDVWAGKLGRGSVVALHLGIVYHLISGRE